MMITLQAAGRCQEPGRVEEESERKCRA